MFFQHPFAGHHQPDSQPVLEVPRGEAKSAREAFYREETLQKCVMEFPVYILFISRSLLKAIENVEKLTPHGLPEGQSKLGGDLGIVFFFSEAERINCQEEAQSRHQSKGSGA